MDRSIGITIGTILKMDALKDNILLGGKEGLDRIISRVSLLEGTHNPPVGELVLMRSEQLENLKIPFQSLLTRLHQSKVKGVGIQGTGVSQLITPGVARLASTLKIPLFQLSTQRGLDKVTIAIQDSIIWRQQQVLTETEDLHQALTHIMLGDGHLAQVVDLLYEWYGNSVAILSDYLAAPLLSSSRYTLKDLEAFLGRAYYPSGDMKVLLHTTRLEKEEVGGRKVSCLVVPIYSDNVPYGNIYIWEDHRKLLSFEQTVVESATSLIAFEIMKATSLTDLENSHRAGFLNDLLSSSRERQLGALKNSTLFHFEPTLPHQVLVVETVPEKNGVIISQGILYRLTNLLTQIVDDLQQDIQLRLHFANISGQLVILCEMKSMGEAEERGQIINLVERLVKSVSYGGLGELLSIGVGRVYTQAGELYLSKEEALKASLFAQNQNMQLAFFQDMGIFRILYHDGLGEELDVFYLEMLAPLLDYDENKDTQLLDTLGGYFQAKGNMTQLAKNLGVHYNTVVYRLQKIFELTGFDLENEEDLLNLQVALKIYEISK